MEKSDRFPRLTEDNALDLVRNGVKGMYVHASDFASGRVFNALAKAHEKMERNQRHSHLAHRWVFPLHDCEIAGHYVVKFEKDKDPVVINVGRNESICRKAREQFPDAGEINRWMRLSDDGNTCKKS